MTTLEKVLVVLIYAASVFIVFAIAGWGFEVLSGYDWSAVGQLLGSMR